MYTFRLVPPVGSPIRLGLAGLSGFADRSDIRLYASGTAALAASMRWLRTRHSSNADEVLLPAYGCPAIVASALFAGLKPVLVDLEPSSPFPSDSSLVARSSASTAAWMHINFLGIPPPQPLTDSPAGAISRIYDCCQGWPPDSSCPEWADVTIVSFGRGKPITVGSGGAVIVNGAVANATSLVNAPADASRSSLSFLLRSALHNAGLRPSLFFWIAKLPGLRVGETRFEPLDCIEGMCLQARRLLSGSVESHRSGHGWTVAQIRATIGQGAFGSFDMLADMKALPGDVRLLRLPLLAEEKAKRDLALAVLKREGFGVTAMYREPLWSFAGLEFLRQYEGNCPNAVDFADRLITLPVHGGVSASMLDYMVRRLELL